MRVEHGGTFGTLKDAKARKALVDGWLAAGLNPAVELRRSMGEGRSVEAVASDWLASRRSVSDRTRVEYRRYANVVSERFADTQPAHITPQDVRAWVGELERTFKPGTVGLYVRALRMILDHADLPVNPARHRSVELPRVPRKTLEPPDGGDVLAVVAALPQRYRLPVVLMEQTGLRISEALTLHVADDDTTRVLIRAEHSKTGRPRWVPCPPWLTEALRGSGAAGLLHGDGPTRSERALDRAGVSAPNHSLAQPRLSRQVVHNALKRACKDAGVTPFGPHMLRHRRATLWHQQGVVAVELAARLGHAKPSMSLDVYTHIPRLSEAPAQRLAALLR